MKDKALNYIIILIVLITIILALYLVLNRETVFTINEDKIVLKVDEQRKIDYSINKSLSITWTSSNSNVATIDNGLITAKEVGSTIITGTIDDKTASCLVTVQAKNKDIILEDIILPDGEILLSTNDKYTIPITYIPSNGYVEKIDTFVLNNDIIKVDEYLITALKPGHTELSIKINDTIKKTIKVNVSDNKVESNIITPVKEIILDKEEIVYVKDTKEIKYTIEPSNGYIYDIKWTKDNDLITIDNNIIKGIKSGETIVNLLVNDQISKDIKIIIKDKLDKISLDYYPKEILKVGDRFILEPTLTPSDTQAKILYVSSNPNVLNVLGDGIVTAIKSGSSTITMKNEDGSVTKSLSFTILNNTGVMNTNLIVWGYTRNTDVIPKKADTEFFLKLTTKGKGTLSNKVYYYKNYSYDIQSGLLTIDNKNQIYMRIYYPENKDLSTLNTFTFIGGVGETNFSGLFTDINNNPSLIKNSGIIILIPENSRVKVQGANVAEATNFVKQIINQNKNARNSIGGYSNGGPPVGDAIEKGNYNKVMIIDSSFYWVSTRDKAKDLEYVIYSPRGDSWRGTDIFINELYNFGVKDVTVITNNTSYIDRFKKKYLVINPGNSMKNGHTSENLLISNFFSYGVH